MLCCVTNCNSTKDNAQRSCFKFPTNKSLRDEWLRKIPADKINKQHGGVCILHFEERFIKRSKDNPLKGRLVIGAIPTIFPKEDNSKEPEPDVQPDLNTEHAFIESHAHTIGSFDTLKANLESMIQLDDWKVAYSESNLHLYKLIVESNGNLRVETSFNIDSDLVLKIFHLDKAIGVKFSKQTVHRSLKLKVWSHLQKLLDKFNGSPDLKIHSMK